ncbi:MAG: hypothetical protein N3G79_05490 [Sulfolobales archaeon]|nr:hypothetical protein [Sulfolobales archaeon]
MPTELKLKAVREARLVGLGVVVALVAIGLIGLVEKGPVVPAIPSGSSPLSPLSYGTLSFYEASRSRYEAIVLLDPEEILRVRSSRCVYVVISPSKPIERDYALKLLELTRGSCSSIAVLVADEESTSNRLLEQLNSSIRVLGNRVGVVVGDRPLYYPEATVVLGRETYRIVLDMASEVVGGRASGYVAGPVVVTPSRSYGSGELAEVRSSVSIASEEVVGGVHVYVLGDGSVFVNQVLNSNVSAYRKFAEDVLDYLCGGVSDCLVVFDARHYESADPLVSLRRAASGDYPTAELRDLLYTSIALAMALAHPAFWLPPLYKVVSDLVFTYIYSPIFYAFLPVLAFFVSRLLFREEGSARDRPMEEQQERDIFIATELRKSVLSGAVKLGSEDFANLYDMVNLVTAAAVGVKLSDELFPKILSRYVGEKKAFEYWKKMNRLYRKAVHRTLWPPVVAWKRSIVKALDESEEILNALGESLLASAGLERLVTYGGSRGVSS